MHPTTWHARGVLCVLLFATLSACAAFPGEKLKASKLPDSASYAHRPSAYVEVKFFQGKPGAANAVAIPAGKDKAQAAVERVLKQNSPFSNYSFDVFDQDKMEYVVKLYYYNHGDTGGAFLGGFISGFTFGVIPFALAERSIFCPCSSVPVTR